MKETINRISSFIYRSYNINEIVSLFAEFANYANITLCTDRYNWVLKDTYIREYIEQITECNLIDEFVDFYKEKHENIKGFSNAKS